MPAKPTTPANVAEFVTARASSGYTTVVMLDPVAESACPVHSSTKSRLRRSGRASPEGCAPGDVEGGNPASRCSGIAPSPPSCHFLTSSDILPLAGGARRPSSNVFRLTGSAPRHFTTKITSSGDPCVRSPIVFRSGLLAEHGSGSIAVLTTVSFVPVLIGCSIGSGAQGEGLSQGRW